MRLAILFSALVAIAVAAPQGGFSGHRKSYENIKGACTYSSNELKNLDHHHDINAGKLKSADGTIKSVGGVLHYNGCGCSPAWAVGGKVDDNTPTKTPANLAPPPGNGKPRYETSCPPKF
jgi:hypothetical protein